MIKLNKDGSVNFLEQIFPKKQVIIENDGSITIDGSIGVEYTSAPRLANKNDLYYSGCGCPWDIDLDGVRYHKLDKYTGKIWDIEARNQLEQIQQLIK